MSTYKITPETPDSPSAQSIAALVDEAAQALACGLCNEPDPNNLDNYKLFAAVHDKAHAILTRHLAPLLERLEGAERERDENQRQVDMDSVRFREMQAAGVKLEVELESLRTRLAEAEKERDNAEAEDKGHRVLIADLQAQVATLTEQLRQAQGGAK